MPKPLRRTAWLVAIPLLLSLACNYPVTSARPTRNVSGEQLRQTLAAPSSGTPGAIENPLASAPAAEGEAKATPATPPAVSNPPAPTPQLAPGSYYLYTTRSGDDLAGLAGRFDVEPGEILLPEGIIAQGLLPAETPLYIPKRLEAVAHSGLLLPDSELVYSPTALDFDVARFVQEAGGYLSRYAEEVDGDLLNGAVVIQRVANELSVNPRLLLAFLEYRSGWVYGEPTDPQEIDYPIGFVAAGRKGLYQEIHITATQLNQAYYGWRQGIITQITYRQLKTARLDPTVNAGTAALQHLFAIFYDQSAWQEALYGANGFLALYQRMFGDAWARDTAFGPLFPPGLTQPLLELPFGRGERWSLTAGPHPAWNTGTPRGALDFAPVTGEPPCSISRAWATAAAPGIIARSGENVVVLDLDGDGKEQTGWVLLYYHLAGELPPARLVVEQDFPLGHPSCEGGRATGTHVHIARKYNGEWLAADGPVPFVLSGWQAHADARNYYGTLVKGDQVVGSNVNGASTSIIVR